MEIKLQEQQALSQIGEPGAPDLVREAAELELKNRIDADGRFLEEVTRTGGETSGERVNDQNSSQSGHETEESKNKRDTAALSDDSKYYKLTEEELADIDKMWGEEAAREAWKEILSWTPSSTAPLPNLLSELEAIYKDLLFAILSNTTGIVKEQQVTQLDEVLADLLIRILNGRTGELNSLFESFGSSEALSSLRSAVYREATGISLTQKELGQIFEKSSRSVAQKGPEAGGSQNTGTGPEEKSKTASGKPVVQTGAADSPTGNIRVPVSDGDGGLEQGVIYQKAGNGQIKNNQQFARRIQAEAGISVYGKAAPSPNGAKALNRAAEGSPVYSANDLERAEHFARYMKRQGNLFSLSGLTGKSEELYGFLAALMTIKSQSFTTYSGFQGRLSSDLREAVDRMIDYYMQKAFQDSKASVPKNSPPPFEPKAAYKIYYYIMNVYQTTRNLQEALNKGIRQAYKQFLKKKELLREEHPDSFFIKEKQDAVMDWKEGKQLLEQDWRDFLAFLGREGLGNVPLGAIELSPWGMFLEQEEKPVKSGGSNPVFLLSTVVLVGIILLFLVFARP